MKSVPETPGPLCRRLLPSSSVLSASEVLPSPAAAAVVLVSAVQDVAAAVQRSSLVGLLICVDVISEQGALPLIVEHNSQQASSCVSFLSMPSALLAPTGCSTFQTEKLTSARSSAGSSSNIICMRRMPSQQNV